MEKERERKLEKLVENLALSQKADNDRLDKKIDSLGEMMAEGFSGFNDKFKKIDDRFDGIDRKLESHDRQFETVNYKLDSLLERVGKVESDIKSIRGVLDDLAVSDTKNRKTNKFLLKEVKRLDAELTRIKKELMIA